MLAVPHGVAFVAIGTWLLFYRIGLRTRFRRSVENATTICAGLTFAVMAPLFSWPPEPYRVVSLALVGVLFSSCHAFLLTLVLAVSLGVGTGSFLWQLGLCHMLPEVLGMSLHPTLLTLVVLLMIVVFGFLPGVAGPETVRHVLVPLVGSLLLVLGLAGLLPDEGLDTRALLAASPCLSDSPLAVHSFGVWMLLTLIGVAFQRLMARTSPQAAADAAADGNGNNADLMSALLPGASQEGGGGASLPRPGDAPGSGDRFRMICKAIYDEEGTDHSHLTETERKIVEVCQKDEFERDRVLWGGGLI